MPQALCIEPEPDAYGVQVMDMKRGMAAILVAGAFMVMAMFHTQIREALLAAGERCVCVLIPSLYCYAVLAAVCTGSGLLMWMIRPLDRFTKRVLHADAVLLAVVVFSQLGGYPVGAQLLHGLSEKGCITRAQEQRMLCACIGCGPGFLLGTVCRNVPGKMAAWILLSVMLPNLLLGILLARGCRIREERTVPEWNAQVFTRAVDSAASGMLKICAMVLLFASIMGIAAPLHLPPVVQTLLEVSCITELRDAGCSFPLAAGLLAFGGICVHLQLAAICGGLPWLRFWGCRILAGAASYGICLAGIRMMPEAVSAGCLLQETAVFSFGAVPGIALLAMSILLLCRRERRI